MKWVFFAGTVLVAACALGQSPPPAPPRQAKLGLSISSLELPNGLKVVLVRDPQAAEVQVTTRYRVGAADDPAGQEGMAHLVEHLMHQQVMGTQSVFAQLESSATAFNAFTSFDATTYVARAESARLEKLLAIEGVRMGFRCTTITEPVFAKERDIVLNEVRQRDQTTELLGAVHAGLFPAGHPYRRAISGSLDSVTAITFADACAFADAHYAPNNAALVIAGNVSPDVVTAALGKFLARIARRSVPARSGVSRAERHERLDVDAPVDEEVILMSWPLPTDPLRATRAMALASAVVATIDRSVAGRVSAIRLGDDRAPLLGVIVAPADDETFDDVTRSVSEALAKLPDAFRSVRREGLGAIGFDNIQQTAIYALYATLEDGSERDARLARYALTGRDPASALAAEFQGLRDMAGDNAADLVAEYFSYARATTVVLKPGEGKVFGSRMALQAAVHDFGPRRDVPDAARAHRPVEPTPVRDVGMRQRTLPNGMKVILLPASSVPTVEIRLVFRAGTADEPTAQRGVALVAAHALTFDLRYFNDLVRFAAAGGSNTLDVDTDRTTFVARGVDMHLDLLLAGLRRWVRDGRYGGTARSIVDALRDVSKRVDDDGTLTDAWRAAIYGPGHRYVHAGLVRHTSASLDVAQVKAFRAAHYTPDNATLIVAGHFDAALADQWIDYLFADWQGRTQSERRDVGPAPPAASIAMARESTLLGLQIALPAVAGERAHRLVAAAMLDAIAGDVRHQLGATYGVSAHFAERVRANHYLIGGLIEPARAADGVALLRDRIANLLADDEAAARAFVAARDRVLIKLRSLRGSAVSLAVRVERDVELSRDPLSDLQTARSVQALTLAHMKPVLADLDLARAVVMMRGPELAMRDAFASLGRTPDLVRVDQVANDTADDPTGVSVRTAAAQPEERDDDDIDISDLEPALTEGGLRAPARVAFMIAPGYVMGYMQQHNTRLRETCCTGPSVTTQIGYRIDAQKTVGLHLALASLSGSYTVDFGQDAYQFRLRPFDVAAYFHASAYERLWGAVLVGAHGDRYDARSPDADRGALTWRWGIGVGLQAGFDVLAWGRHRLGAFGLAQGVLASDTGYSALTLGVSYRQ